jgi:hypothetical protein
VRDQGERGGIARFALERRGGVAHRLVALARGGEQLGQVHPQRHVVGGGLNSRAQAAQRL